MNKTWRKLLALFLLVIFCTFQANNLLFIHVHYIDGVAVAHSHINGGKHTHSADGFSTIALLSSFHSLKADITSYLLLTPIIFLITLLPKNTVHILKKHLRISHLRAPPFPQGR